MAGIQHQFENQAMYAQPGTPPSCTKYPYST